MQALPLCLRIILKHPCLISSDYFSKEIRLLLNHLKDVSANIGAVVLVIISQQFWYHLGTDFPHSKIFSQYGPDCLPVHPQFIGNHPNSQSPISTHHAIHTVDVVCSFGSGRRPDFGSSSTSSQPLLKHLCHSNTHARDMQSSPYTF